MFSSQFVLVLSNRVLYKSVPVATKDAGGVNLATEHGHAVTTVK